MRQSHSRPTEIKRRLLSAIAVEVPKDHIQHYRPIMLTDDDNAFDMLRQMTDDGRNVDNSAIREAAHDIIGHSRQSQGELAISNGWDNNRFAMFLEIEIETPTSVTIHALSGYTDQVGMSELTGPSSRFWFYDMLFTISSHMRVSTRQKYGPQGEYIDYTANKVDNILIPTDVIQGGRVTGRSQYSARPTDNLRLQAVLGNGAVRENMIDPDLEIPTGGAKLGRASRRLNEIPSHYLSHILTSTSSAYASSNGNIGGDSWMRSKAANYAREADLSSDTLFRVLAEGTGYTDAGNLTFGELCDLFPNLEDEIEVSLIPRDGMIDARDEFNEWGAPDRMTEIATALSHALPTLLSQFKQQSMNFEVTNMTRDGLPAAAVTGETPIFARDRRAVTDQMCTSIENDVMPEIMMLEDGDYEINGRCSIFGRTVVNISLDGYAFEPFSKPNYCSGMTSSTLMTDVNDLDHIVRRSGKMIDDVFANNDNPAAAAHLYNGV